VIGNVRKRDRQRARLMQAELDGRGQAEVPRSVRRAFIEPRQAEVFAIERLNEERKQVDTTASRLLPRA
jgi:hypothetical protein